MQKFETTRKSSQLEQEISEKTSKWSELNKNMSRLANSPSKNNQERYYQIKKKFGGQMISEKK